MWDKVDDTYVLSEAVCISLCFIMQRTKIISDLLISVSKAERQEARMKVRQDSLRLGNVGVIRYNACVTTFYYHGLYAFQWSLLHY